MLSRRWILKSVLCLCFASRYWWLLHLSTKPRNYDSFRICEKTLKLNLVLVVESKGVCNEGQCVIRNNGGRQSDYSEDKRKNSCCCSDNCDMRGQRDSKMAVRRAWSVLASCSDDNGEGQIFYQMHHSENWKCFRCRIHTLYLLEKDNILKAEFRHELGGLVALFPFVLLLCIYRFVLISTLIEMWLS